MVDNCKSYGGCAPGDPSCCDPLTDVNCKQCSDCDVRRNYLDGMLAFLPQIWLENKNLNSLDPAGNSWLHYYICQINESEFEGFITCLDVVESAEPSDFTSCFDNNLPWNWDIHLLNSQNSGDDVVTPEENSGIPDRDLSVDQTLGTY
jgi:hypothetical protein